MRNDAKGPDPDRRLIEGENGTDLPLRRDPAYMQTMHPVSDKLGDKKGKMNPTHIQV